MAYIPGAICPRTGTGAALAVPGNTTFLSSQRRSPKLNPGENIWQRIRENWLSNRVFMSYEDIDAHTSDAWSRLT